MSCGLIVSASSISSRRTFCFVAKIAKASGVKAGAINTSTNCFETASAVAPSHGLLNAMIPPKADVESVLNAF